MRAELSPYAAGHTSCPLPIRDTINGIPLGSRRADGSRLWRPRSATGVFSCVGYAWTTTRPHGHGGATWSMESEADQRGAPLLSLRCSTHRRLPAPLVRFQSVRFGTLSICVRTASTLLDGGRKTEINRSQTFMLSRVVNCILESGGRQQRISIREKSPERNSRRSSR